MSLPGFRKKSYHFPTDYLTNHYNTDIPRDSDRSGDWDFQSRAVREFYGVHRGHLWRRSFNLFTRYQGLGFLPHLI